MLCPTMEKGLRIFCEPECVQQFSKGIVGMLRCTTRLEFHAVTTCPDAPQVQPVPLAEL